MEERCPGGFSPTKWAQFANSPRPGRRGLAAAGGGARRRLRPGPAALLPPGARSRPDFPAEGEWSERASGRAPGTRGGGTAAPPPAAAAAAKGRSAPARRQGAPAAPPPRAARRRGRRRRLSHGSLPRPPFLHLHLRRPRRRDPAAPRRAATARGTAAGGRGPSLRPR
uniref:homeobox protein cut-like 1 n=1 Tax=Panthera onca TaxID=9690 RepID=UPI000904AEAB|nr:homeobox protein cut-like 1 [Panthera onca]